MGPGAPLGLPRRGVPNSSSVLSYSSGFSTVAMGLELGVSWADRHQI